jgi:hypothetical protein
MTRYLLDANVFIQAKQRHYGMDFCPAFWEWLIAQHGVGHVFSVEKVGDELAAVGDELATWAAARGAAFFLVPEAPILPSLTAVSTWVSGQKYEPAAVSAFLEVADYYLVAHAHAQSFVVVTHEVPSDGVKKVKIPNVCIGMRVKCMSPFEMLRVERARFVLPRGEAA